ncbi:hypothetical protein KZX45_05770 [Georgenia sp. EYE_87]|uniref:hypothetical protein n=1 Tax=Georgenia sp. EYE_87 TaxID=2853448 RepID=UPI0020043DD0|nr:hypothetical protein [Georgenia sp. EYE_87]MCK6210049.1 hypothetical protein [Georgenia sp. EYE_87]
MAEHAPTEAVQRQLLEEARGKFDDAAVRKLGRLPHGWSMTLLAGTSQLLGVTELACRTGVEALVAADEALSYYSLEMDHYRLFRIEGVVGV